MTSRLQKWQDAMQKRIEKARSVTHVKIERDQPEPEVQLRIVIERTGAITF